MPLHLKFTLHFTILLCILYAGTVFAQNHADFPPWFGLEEETAQKTAPNALPNADNVQLDHIPALEQNRNTKEKALSVLEKMYADRVIDEPKQFGYDLFHSDNGGVETDLGAVPPMGAVQDDFILNSGDELTITFTGQRNDQSPFTIDTRGMLIIPDLAPISAMGRSIASVRAEINAQASAMPNTKAYVSLSKIRQIGVLIVGHVEKPGRKTLNAFHSVLDALNIAGGIRKDGSLRAIKLVRDGRSKHIDLYALLIHGAPHIDTTLQDGDRLIIPPIGPTVAISGSVKRPGIYEIRKVLRGINAHTQTNSELLSLNAMLDLAGGVLTPGKNRYMKLAYTHNGQENVEEVQDSFQAKFGDGAILSVLTGEAKRQGTVELIGHTRRPGLYDLSQHKTLSSLLRYDDILGEDIYPLIGVIERWNKNQLTKQYLSFPVRSVLKHKFDLKLSNSDVVHLLSNQFISDIYDKKNK